MTVFKTFFWTSVVWALALVGLWFGAEYELKIAQLWAMAVPQAAQQFLIVQGENLPLEQPDFTQDTSSESIEEVQNSEVFSGTTEEQNNLQEEPVVVVDEERELVSASPELTSHITPNQNNEALNQPVQVEVENPSQLALLQQQLNFYKSRAEVLEYYITILLNEKAERFGLPTQVQ